MNNRPSRKNIILITGCSSGIGRALAEEFHSRDCRVIATARNLSTLSDLDEKGMATYAMDVTRHEDLDRVVDDVLRTEGGIDVLVNNAGYGLMGPIIDISDEDLTRQFRTNVFAPLDLSRKIAPTMKERKRGVIVNIGSVSGIVTTPFAGAYCASKAAFNALSDAMRLELAPFGIQVMTVQPGAVKSDFGQSAARTAGLAFSPESWYAALETQIRNRAQFSQKNAMPTKEFVKIVADAALREKVPAVLRAGKMSLYPVIMKRLLPEPFLDKMLRKKFGMDQVEAGRQAN